MKACLYIGLFLCLFCVTGLQSAHGQQKDSTLRTTQDTTPVELLDYKLTKYQFLNYYGTDDTAKALINLFFRKRSNSIYNSCIPMGSALTVIALSDGLVLMPPNAVSKGVVIVIGAVAVGYLVRGIVQRIVYSRKTLLYQLIDRENGYPLPQEYREKLQKNDFGN